MARLAADTYDFDVNDNGYPVSSYSGSSGTKSVRIDLFYLDTETMEKMIAFDGRWREPYDNGVDILLRMPEDAHGCYPQRFNVRTRQYQYTSNGRSNMVENLYTARFLRHAFADWQIEELVEYEDDLSEGTGHKGRSALIGLVARKPG